MPSTHLSLHVHVIFSTKHRRPVLKAEWRSRLHAYLGGAVSGVEAVPLVIGGTADHVHLLLGLKATHRIADVIREIKRGSSNWLNDDLNIRGFAWQSGYGAFSVSPSALESVARYISLNKSFIIEEGLFRKNILSFLTSVVSYLTSAIYGMNKLSLASLQDALSFFDGSRDFRFAPIPGYLLESLRDTGSSYPPAS
jgi:REP-associated tyrosine transposase